MDVYERINFLGISLPSPPGKGGLYSSLRTFSQNLAYVSGCGSQIAGENSPLGKVGREISEEEGKTAAVNCIRNLLAVVEREIGDLNRIKRFVKLLVFVASDDEFYNQPQVADYASQVLVDVFGEEIGSPARSAIGMNVLPGNIPVEIEALIELA